MFDLKFVSCLPEAERNTTFMNLNGPSYRSSEYVAVTFLAKYCIAFNKITGSISLCHGFPKQFSFKLCVKVSYTAARLTSTRRQRLITSYVTREVVEVNTSNHVVLLPKSVYEKYDQCFEHVHFDAGLPATFIIDTILIAMKEIIAFVLITVCVVFIKEARCSTEICYPIPRVVENQKGQGEPGLPGKRGPAGPQGVKGESESCVCATEDFESLRSQLQTLQGKVQNAELKTHGCVACLHLAKIHLDNVSKCFCLFFIHRLIVFLSQNMLYIAIENSKKYKQSRAMRLLRIVVQYVEIASLVYISYS